MGEHEERTIWAMTFRDRVGRATITQSMFGMSAPSVRMAEPFEDIRLVSATGDKDDEPQFTRTGYFPVLKSSIIDFRLAAGVLEYTYLASIPASRNVCVSSMTWERLTQNINVDLRLSAPRESEGAVIRTGKLTHRIYRARFVQLTNSTSRY